MKKIMVVKTSDELEKIEKEGLIKTTIMAGNGMFEKSQSWLGYSIRKINDYKSVGYPDITEELVIADKEFERIPKELFLYILKWYRDITNKNGEEAQVNIYKCKTKEKRYITIDDKKVDLKDIEGVYFWTDTLFTYTPLQNNQGAVTKVDSKDKYYDILNKQIGTYIETHSHNKMNAFRSGTDESNSEMDGLQLVFGKLDTATPEMYSWITIRQYQKAGLSKEDVLKFVELPECIISNDKLNFNYDDITRDFEFNDEIFKNWDSRIVEIPVVTYKSNKWKNNSYNSYSNTLYGNYNTSYNKYYQESLSSYYNNFECDLATEISEELVEVVFAELDTLYTLSPIQENFILELINLSTMSIEDNFMTYTEKKQLINKLKTKIIDLFENMP